MAKSGSKVFKMLLWVSLFPLLILSWNLIFKALVFLIANIHKLSITEKFAIYQVAGLILSIIVFYIVKKSYGESFSIKDEVSKIRPLFLFKCLCVFLAVKFIFDLTDFPNIDEIISYLKVNNFLSWKNIFQKPPDHGGVYPVNSLLVLSLVVIAPLFEELLFRGSIYHSMRKDTRSMIPSIIASSLVFAIRHFVTLDSWIYNTPQFIYYFLMGILFAYCYEKTQTVLATMLLHGVINGYFTFYKYIIPIYATHIYLVIGIICTLIVCVLLLMKFIKYLHKVIAKKPAEVPME